MLTTDGLTCSTKSAIERFDIIFLFIRFISEKFWIAPVSCALDKFGSIASVRIIRRNILLIKLKIISIAVATMII
jgi:hypothetical protein